MKSVFSVRSLVSALALVAAALPAWGSSNSSSSLETSCDIFYSGPRQSGPGTRVDVLDPKVGGTWMKVPENLTAAGDLLTIQSYLGYSVSLMQFAGDRMVEIVLFDEKTGVTQDLRLAWAQESEGSTRFISVRSSRAQGDQFELYCSRN